LLPQDGLILDVRGNGGGLILAGERLLQLFTPNRIEAERLHFINTQVTQTLAQRHDFLKPWQPSIEQAIETGATFSQGFPIEPEEQTNSLGQRYFGPVVLITDARCYSTTDIFSAGFQDHKIGPILGTDGNTGAGGANVWTHGLLAQLLVGTPFALKPLPKGSSMRVAIRRTTRVKDNSGVPVEDLGVIPDEIHRITRDDLFQNNKDLIERAAQLLKTRTPHKLAGALSSNGGKVALDIETKNLDRVDVVAGGRPRATVDVGDGATRVALTQVPADLRLEGYSKGSLVAERRVQVAT
jgi:C-terminal processing protease CtpA/Prc